MINGPNFIIAGAEKSGTSSLSFYLSEHPDIYIPAFKEVHFFENPDNYAKGLEWYERQFSGWSGEKAVGECTPFYMYDPECPAKIRKHFPDIKIIFILRNPVDRTYSNYWHQVRGGKEIFSFESALQKESKRISKSRFHYFTYSYLHKGFYSVQMKRFLDLFDKNRIYVLKFEDLKNSPQEILKGIYHFLGVSDLDNQKTLRSVKNRSILPGSKTVQFAARKLLKTSVLFKAVAKVNLKFGDKKYPPMKKETRQALTRCFSHDIEKLEHMTRKNFQSWMEE